MKRFLSSLLARFAKGSKSGNSLSRKNQARLGVECLEGREIMTAAPLAPSFTTTAVSATQINLNWNAVSGATGYYVDVKVNNGAWQTPTYMGNTTSAVFNTLHAGNLYTFDVQAYNSATGEGVDDVTNVDLETAFLDPRVYLPSVYAYNKGCASAFQQACHAASVDDYAAYGHVVAEGANGPNIYGPNCYGPRCMALQTAMTQLGYTMGGSNG